VAGTLEGLLHRSRARPQAHRAPALLAGRLRLDDDAEDVVDGDGVAGPEAAPGPDERLPAVVAQGAEQQHLGRAAGRAPAEQAGREDAAAIDHEQIAGPQQPRQVSEHVVGRFPLHARQPHQPRGITGLDRFLRDSLRRQLVIEVGDTQS
jgi:hypothetical protein